MNSHMKKLFVTAVASIALAGSTLPAAAFLACQVTDTAGIDDRGFNETSWKGMQEAGKELDIDVKVLESTAETDYDPNINTLVSQNCDIIVTVGFKLGEATAKAAKANPDTKFSIVDFAFDPAIPNVLGQVFATDEAAFLAGYLAAGMSKSGKIGTFGGLNIPPVAAFMDGYTRGAQYYNAEKGTNVAVLGWDTEARDGLFTGNFNSLADGRSFAQNLYDEGADIVLPVAGAVGLGAAALANELGADELKIIGVDADNAVTNFELQHVYLTSIVKLMDTTVASAVKAAHDGSFEGGVIRGTLENGGVTLAPYHAFEDSVPAELVDELDNIRTRIIAGEIKTKG